MIQVKLYGSARSEVINCAFKSGLEVTLALDLNWEE